MTMTSSRPYMVRALYEWIIDNECTPHILVNAMASDTRVPQQFVKDGQIVLNISPSAVRDLVITNDVLDFSGRFSGVPMAIHVPMEAVMGIYARENGQGMVFELEPPPTTPDGNARDTDGGGKTGGGRPGLKVVK